MFTLQLNFFMWYELKVKVPFFLHGEPIVLKPFLKRLPFPHVVILLKINWAYMCGSIFELSSIALILPVFKKFWPFVYAN